MPNKADPYSRLTDGMRPMQADDDPSNLPAQEDKAIYARYTHADRQIQNATDDVSGAAWAETETYRRLNCRGKGEH